MQLRDKEIIDLLLDYVKDKRYKQAVLIDGKWGTGKTYFVKEKLLNSIKKNLPERSVFYISLYGISKPSQIIEEIYSATVGDFLEKRIGKEKGEKVEKGINIASKLFAAGIKYFNIEKSDLPSFADIKEIKESIIVFDDLERCELEVNQSLGFINNLVEHNDIKVILVANQDEIGKMNIPKDLPQKYILALDDRINFKGNDNSNNKQKEGKKVTYSREQLIERTNTLFSEDLLYEKIKEKLIGLTIYYQADIDSVFLPLVEKYIDSKKIKEYLLKHKDIIADLFCEKKHYNIRTLIFGIMAFEKFYDLLDKLVFEPQVYKDEQIQLILNYTITLSVQIKTGEATYSWTNSSSKAGVVHLGRSFWEQRIFGYKFVDDYLLWRYFNEEEIMKTVIDIMEERKNIDNSKRNEMALSFHALYQWWELEDEEIMDKLTKLRKELHEKKYSPRYFKDIIVMLMQMKHNGFDEIELDEYISSMRESLIEWGETFERKNIEVLSDDVKFVKDYNEIIQPLFEIIDCKVRNEKQNDNSFLNNRECWNNEFVKKCEDNRNNYILDKRFLFYVNPDEIIAQLASAKTNEIYALVDGIKAVYNFSNLNEFFKEDISNIMCISQGISEKDLSNGKITKKMALGRLNKVLQDSLDLIRI